MNIESPSKTMISYRLEVIGMSLCYFDCQSRDNFIDTGDTHACYTGKTNDL